MRAGPSIILINGLPICETVEHITLNSPAYAATLYEKQDHAVSAAENIIACLVRSGRRGFSVSIIPRCQYGPVLHRGQEELIPVPASAPPAR